MFGWIHYKGLSSLQQKPNSKALQCFLIVAVGISSHSEEFKYQLWAQKQ